MVTLFLMSLMAIAGLTYLGSLMAQQHQQKKQMQLQPIRIKRPTDRH